METNELEQRLTLTEKIENLIISSTNFEESKELLKQVKQFKAQIDCLFDPGINAAKDTVKKLMDSKNQFLLPLKELENNVTTKQREYYFQKEKEATEKRKQLETEARKRAEEEKLRVAIQKEASGQEKEVEKLLEEPVVIEKIKVTPAIKVDKRSFKKKWKIEITNLSLLPAKYMIPDEKAILADIRKANGEIQIPGVIISFE